MMGRRKCQKRTLLLLLSVIGVFALLLWTNYNEGGVLDVERYGTAWDMHWTRDNAEWAKNDKALYILLNSYMRAGSSFTGELLGHRNNTFYYYEPLYGMATYGYFRGKKTKCSSLRMSCKEDDAFGEAFERLSNIFSCNEAMAKRIWWLVVANAGTQMDPYKQCKKDIKTNITSEEECYKVATGLCKDAKYRVMKVLRLATENLEPLLITHPNLKAIHLFRDPRALLLSRNNSKWYPGRQRLQPMLTDIEGQCFRMDNDYREGLILEKKYPNRFRMILYEDLISDLPTKTKGLFKFLGLKYTDADDQKIAFQTDKSLNISMATGDNSRSRVTGKVDRSKNYAFSWRTSLDWEIVRSVDQRCQYIYKHFGYQTYKNKEEMRDMNVPGMVPCRIKPL